MDAGSPADQAGILPGDRLETVNGQSAVGITEDGTAWNLTVLVNSYQEGGEPLTLGVRRGVEDIAMVTLTHKDVVRHELVQAIVKAYEKHSGRKENI